MLDEATKREIFSLIESVVDNEASLFKYEINFVVKPDYFKYGGDGIKAETNVVGIDHNNKELTLNLCIIMSDKSAIDDPVRKAYLREKFFYENASRCMFAFVHDKGVREHSRIISPPYKMFSTEEREVFIFNSLASMGYSEHARILTVNNSTLYCVLRSLAQFHAISFAYRDQQSEHFGQIMSNWKPDIKDLFIYSNIQNKLNIGLKTALDILTDEGRTDLKNKLLTDTESGVLAVIEKVITNVPKEAVIIHGDAWMNNVFILYEKDNPEIPVRVRFKYWYMSTLHSPVLDLAYFLYFTYSEDVHLKFEHYVEYYHREFSNYLVKLGSDPMKFSFLTLLDHWKTYSIMPLVVALGGVHLVLVDKYLNMDIEEYESFEYSSLDDNVRSLIKEKLLGILELHYKYF